MECAYKGKLVEIYKVAPNIYFRKADLKTRGMCNSIYIEGETSVAVVDPSTPEAVNEICHEIELLFHKPLSHVFLTHGHRDHAEGMPDLLLRGVTVFCSDKLVNNYAAYKSDAVIIGIERKAIINFEKTELELIVLDQTAHSPWDMLVGIPDSGLLCTGDLVVEYPALFFHYANPEQWERCLQKIMRMDYKIILPGHGPVMPIENAGEIAYYLNTLICASGDCIKKFVPVLKQKEDLDFEEITSIVKMYLDLHLPQGEKIMEKAGADAVRQMRMMVRLLRFRTLF